MIGNQTLRSARAKNLLAARPELDLLLRLAGTTQIAEALGRVGYGVKGRKQLVALGAERDLAPLERLASKNPRRFKRSPTRPLNATDLEAIEGAALLDALRG